MKNNGCHTVCSAIFLSEYVMVTELMENHQLHLQTNLAVERSPTATSRVKETVT